MQKLIFALLMIALFPVSVLAQTTSTGDEFRNTVTNTDAIQKCSDAFSLVGPVQVRANVPTEYSLVEKESGKAILPFGIFRLETNGATEETLLEREKFVYSFSVPEIAKISLSLDKNVHNCEGEITAEIHVYREEIIYLGSERSELADPALSNIFREKSVLFEPIFTGPNFKAEEQSGIINAVANADIVVFNYTDIISVFSELEKIQKIKDTSFVKKKIFIISPYQRTFLSKVLASTLAKLEAENVYVINTDQLNVLLNQWSYGDNRDVTLGEQLSYEKTGFTFSMNSFLEYLSYSGVSYTFLGFMLVLSVVALIFNIFKQVIGFDVFSIYYPMMLAIIMAQLWFAFSMAFLILALVAILIVRGISYHIQLLFNAKKSFLISMYILLIFLTLGIDNVWNIGIFDYSHFDKAITILAIFAILFIVEKIVENISIFSRSGAILVVQYIFVVTVAYLVLTSTTLQYFFISFPDLIFVIVILNLLVWRYMWLQLVEYVRFLPILRNLNEEE